MNDTHRPPKGRRRLDRRKYFASPGSESPSVLPISASRHVTRLILTPTMSHTPIRVTQHRNTSFRGRLIVPFFPETPLCTYTLHHADHLRTTPWPEMSRMKDRLGSMRRYRYEERMSGERLDEVFDEKVVLQLKISILRSRCCGVLTRPKPRPWR
jgi:hypothetical protein